MLPDLNARNRWIFSTIVSVLMLPPLEDTGTGTGMSSSVVFPPVRLSGHEIEEEKSPRISPSTKIRTEA